VFVIGIDPDKASHTAVVLDCHEQLVSEVRVRADHSQRNRLLTFAAGFEPRCWAVEGATGTGALLAQQLVAVGETVLDVPPALSARVRLLDNTRSDKTDAHDARSPRSWRCGTRNCGWSGSRITPWCCDSLRNVTMTWSRIAPGRSVTSTRCSASSLRAASPEAFLPQELRPSCVASDLTMRLVSNADASQPSSWPRVAAPTPTSSSSRPASPRQSPTPRRP
jgi:hypothetical protein